MTTKRLPHAAPIPVLALLAIAAPGPPQNLDAQTITAVSWGGSYGRAVNEGVNIEADSRSGSHCILLASPFLRLTIALAIVRSSGVVTLML